MTPFTLYTPGQGEAALPLVLDSPHSGCEFPPGFSSPASAADLKTAWDAHIDDLWSGAVEAGATLLAANFPRVVIDTNRAPDDIDPALLAGAWPEGADALNPTRYSTRGMGLIRRDILPGKPMHAGKLLPKTVIAWRDALHRPYHDALSRLIQDFQARHGQVWHINCHSMKSMANAMNVDHGKTRPDIVLGDLGGTSAAPDFTQHVKTLFEAGGFSVAVNHPYRGGYIVARHGAPERGVHSLQIEINRALYLDERTAEKSSTYPAFKCQLTAIASRIAAFVRDRVEILP